MADVTKKAGGYVQVKLIQADRSSQTWSGWARRWVDLLLVKQDSVKTNTETFAEAWIEVRKSKSSGRPIKMWTIDAKHALVYRCTSKSKNHPFGIKFKGKDLLYISGSSESESQEWIKLIRETLWPTDKTVELEISAGRLFEASVIDNHYSLSCELFGRYGHLAIRENKLMLFDHNGKNIIQEWYLHTIRKLDAFKCSQVDTGRLLSVHLGENSSTGCGVLYLFCPRAVLLLETVQATIKEIFSNLEDERKAHQATLMSLGALHDITLEDTESKPSPSGLKTITISDEIMKAKHELTVGGLRGTPRPSNAAPIEEAADKDEPLVWKDNDPYEDMERADYVPERDEPLKDAKKQRSQSLVVMTRPRANSCTLELDLPDLTKLKDQLMKRRSSLPQRPITDELNGRMSLPTETQLVAGQMRQGLHSFRQVLNLSATKDGVSLNEVCQIVGENGEGQRRIVHETSEVIHRVPIAALGAVEEDEETADEPDSRGPTAEALPTIVPEVTLELPEHIKDSATSASPEKSSVVEKETSPIENTASSSSADTSKDVEIKAHKEPVMDLRGGQPEPNDEADKEEKNPKETKSSDDTEGFPKVGVSPPDSENSHCNKDAPIIQPEATGDVNIDKGGNERRDSSHTVTINFGSGRLATAAASPAAAVPGTPPPKPRRMMQFTKGEDEEVKEITSDSLLL